MCPPAAAVPYISLAFTVISGGFQIYSMMQQMNADDTANSYEQQMLEERRRQQEEEAKARELQMQKDLNDRKREALKLHKSNRASLAASGAEIGSPSFSNFLLANREAEGRDQSNITLMGREAQAQALMDARQTGIAKDASLAAYKSRRKASIYSGVAGLVGMGANVNWSAFAQEDDAPAPKEEE